MEFKELVKESLYHDKTGMLLKGDCLDWMDKFPNKSIDMILADLPYGTTACKWDVILPFNKLWEQYERIIKPDGAMLFTSSQPFTSLLVMSNLKLFKYEYIWDKCNPTGHLMAKRRPMKQHESVLMFCLGQETYNPQFEYIDETDYRYRKNGRKRQSKLDTVYGITENEDLKETGKRYPKSIIKISNSNGGKKLHPTQKSVLLFEYLIKTHSNENNIILDNTAGVCTTAIAAKNTNRRWICIEKDEKYCDISLNRIKNWILPVYA